MLKNSLLHWKNEKGLAVVEAAILLPFCILIVAAMYYAALFLCQKANLQANLNNTMIYFKNVESDTYVSAQEGMTYKRGPLPSAKEEKDDTSKDDDTEEKSGSSKDGSDTDASVSATISGEGAGYSVDKALFPYRFFTMEFSGEDDFADFFHSMCGYMFFDDGSNVEITADTTNYVVYKQLYASATQVVKPAISFKLIGLDDSLTISAHAKCVIFDADDFIRNVDLVTDLVSSTKFGGLVDGLVDSVKDIYGSFKSMLK